MNKFQFNKLARNVGLMAMNVLCAFTISSQAGPERVAVEKETQAYYAQWLGVPAPESKQALRDRGKGDRLRIDAFRGNRLLLFSFNAGNFVDPPDKATLVPQLTALDRIRKLHTNDLAVVGFTYGVMFFLPGKEPSPEIKAVTDFPIVNSANIELNEPYNLLQRWPSAILIDRNGIIIGIYPKTLTEQQLAEALLEPDWNGKLRPAPNTTPSELVRNYSSRKPFLIHVYRKDVARGVQFQSDMGERGKVYLNEEVPQDAVKSLKEVEGKTLRTSVRKGDPIRRIDFDK